LPSAMGDEEERKLPTLSSPAGGRTFVLVCYDTAASLLHIESQEEEFVSILAGSNFLGIFFRVAYPVIPVIFSVSVFPDNLDLRTRY